MKTCSGKDFAKILEKRGWVLVRINGSHHIYAKEGIEQKISLPVHRNESLKLGMQKFFMKVAQITDSDLI
jgi:predicted RNA binding protein YcfA (HicA-like mRNA interferase family)